MGAAASLCLGGCAPTPQKPSPSIGPYRPGLLSRTIASGDREAFLGAFAPAESPQSVGRLVWENARTLAVTDLGDGDGASITMRWKVAGERHGTNEGADLVLTSGWISELRPQGAVVPLWLLEPLSVRSAPVASVVAGPLPNATTDIWLRAAAEASRIVAQADLGQAAAGWDGVLVIELPAHNFGRVAGLTGDAALGSQAATIMATPDSAPRIVGNAAGTASFNEAGLRTLCVHEGVHVAVRSAVSKAPLWLTEGLAESVAQASDPQTAARNRALARAARPSVLPTDDQLNGPDAATFYAIAAAAVDGAIARWGRPSVMAWVADWPAAAKPSDGELAKEVAAQLDR